jgi:hypothetical protein
MERRTPAGRWDTAEELVGACVSLASDAAPVVNGHVLYVDGSHGHAPSGAHPAAISMPPRTCPSRSGSLQYTPLWPSAV